MIWLEELSMNYVMASLPAAVLEKYLPLWRTGLSFAAWVMR
jgi:hypothetical protein